MPLPHQHHSIPPISHFNNALLSSSRKTQNNQADKVSKSKTCISLFYKEDSIHRHCLNHHFCLKTGHHSDSSAHRCLYLRLFVGFALHVSNHLPSSRQFQTPHRNPLMSYCLLLLFLPLQMSRPGRLALCVILQTPYVMNDKLIFEI